MIPFEIFIGDEYFGMGVSDVNTSYHYLCPHCGTIWARLISASSQHCALRRPCPDHDGDEVLWTPAVVFQEFSFYKIRFSQASLERDFLYLMSKCAPIIHHNLAELST